MADEKKVWITIKEQGGDKVIADFGSKTLTEAFPKLAVGTVVDVFMREPETKDQFVGNYVIRGESVIDVTPEVCPDGQHWDATLKKCVDDIISHECPEGQHWDDAAGRCVDNIVTPEVGLLYNCIKHGKWNQNRTITDYDLLFPKPFRGAGGIILAASGANKKLEIANGIAKFTAGKGHPRYYTDIPNYNTYTVYDLMFLSLVTRNHTHQKQSRHNMGGANENRFGGFNHLIDIEGQKCGLKIELWHEATGENHISGPTANLPHPIKTNQWVGIKNTDQIKGRNVLSKTELDYHTGAGWELGVQKTYDLSGAQYDFIFNEKLYRDVSSEWFRMNPNVDGGGFSVKDYNIFQL